MFAVVYRRTKRAFHFHARYSIKGLISRHIRSRSLTRQFYGPNFTGFLAQIFAQNVRAVQMSCSFLVHFSFSFYRSCQADYRHALSRSLVRHFYGQNLAHVSLRIFVRERPQDLQHEHVD